MKMVKTTKFPEFEIGESAEESLLNFYVALGWDRKQPLNVRKVVINYNQAMELSEKIQSKEESQNAAGLFYLNYGPSPNEDIPYGKVKLYDGWLTE
jgi:hypothetical protein